MLLSDTGMFSPETSLDGGTVVRLLKAYTYLDDGPEKILYRLRQFTALSAGQYFYHDAGGFVVAPFPGQTRSIHSDRPECIRSGLQSRRFFELRSCACLEQTAELLDGFRFRGTSGSVGGPHVTDSPESFDDDKSTPVERRHHLKLGERIDLQNHVMHSVRVFLFASSLASKHLDS